MTDFTNGIKVGDIVTGYHNGYHVVVSIERRYEDGYCLPKGKKVGDEMFKIFTHGANEICPAWYIGAL